MLGNSTSSAATLDSQQAPLLDASYRGINGLDVAIPPSLRSSGNMSLETPNYSLAGTKTTYNAWQVEAETNVGAQLLAISDTYTAVR